MASMTIEGLVPNAEVQAFPRGPIGPAAELRLHPDPDPTHIQWRQENGTWADLIALSELIGPVGPVGITWKPDGWDGVTEFAERDVVLHEDVIWIATADNIDSEPGSTGAPWDVLLDGSDAAADRLAASAARDKAEAWAETPEDTEVEPGQYSSLHHAAKSAASATAAGVAKTDTETARDKAEKWAEEVEDTEVEPGQFSAKHWAAKAQDAVSGGASTISFAPAGNISADNVQAALEEVDAEKVGASDLNAGNVSFTPSGGVEADDVQAAIEEVDAALASKQDTSAKGQANGYAGLDGDGKVPSSHIAAPAIGAIGDVVVAASSTMTLPSELAVGDTVAGSSLIVHSSTTEHITLSGLESNLGSYVDNGESTNLGFSGTWRACSRAYYDQNNFYPVCLFMRIS